MRELEPGDIADLIETGQFEEGTEFEAKRAHGSVPRNAWETISAFANGAGGALVFGLEEDRDGWHITGVSDPDQMIREILHLMRDRTKISYEVATDEDIWKEQVGVANLVVVRVKAASRRHKPVYLNGDRDLAFFRRGDGDVRCSHDELDRMRRETLPSTSDMRVIPFLGFNDFDLEAVERYRALSQQSRPGLANHRLGMKKFLRSVEAWRLDRELNVEGPTLAGILMFGDTLAIREVRSNHVIDYRRVPADHTPSRRWTDRVRWTGHLFGA